MGNVGWLCQCIFLMRLKYFTWITSVVRDKGYLWEGIKATYRTDNAVLVIYCGSDKLVVEIGLVVGYICGFPGAVIFYPLLLICPAE